MKANEEITQELAEFVNENDDEQLNIKLRDAVLDVLTDEKGCGNTRKAMCAMARVTSVLLKVWASKMKDGEHTATELMETYTDVLDFYCLMIDLPDPDKEEEEEE